MRPSKGGGGVTAGSSYDLVFLSYATPPAEDGSLQILAGLQFAPEYVGTATVVPKPGTGALVALCVALVAAHRREQTELPIQTIMMN